MPGPAPSKDRPAFARAELWAWRGNLFGQENSHVQRSLSCSVWSFHVNYRSVEPGEALSAGAQIAVALAGFAGVVVAFRSGPLHEWSAVDKYRLWLLLGNALVPLFSCLVGMLVSTIEPRPASAWRWCSGFSLVAVLAFGLLSRRRQSELGPRFSEEMTAYRNLFYTVGVLGIVVLLAQLYNVFVAGLFWLFYLGIVFQLGVGGLQFARLILLPPHRTRTG